MGIEVTWWPSTAPTELSLLLCAFVLSAVVGIERQRQMKSAGLRTHTLVGLGAALFTLVSAYGFTEVLDDDVVLDPSRISAQIVSGVGFLGAGVIFVRRNVVSGLTTAASVWMTAAIGMACGAGMPMIAAVATGLHLLAVTVLARVGRLVPGKRAGQDVSIQYFDHHGVIREVLRRASKLGYETSLSYTKQVEPREGGVPTVAAGLTFHHRGHAAPESLVATLSEIEGMTSIRLNESEND